MLKLPVTKDKRPFDPLDCEMAVWHNLVQLSRALELLMAELGDNEGSLMDPAMRDKQLSWSATSIFSQRVYWKGAFQIEKFESFYISFKITNT